MTIQEARRFISNYYYNNNVANTSAGLEKSPLFFARGGLVYGSSLYNSGYYGDYWSSFLSWY